MTIPDYHNQSRLPTGVTISLWDDRSTIFNVDNIETAILHPENYKNLQWADALDDNETYWFSAVTMTEYGTMVNEEGKIDKLPGSIRKVHHGPNKRGSNPMACVPPIARPHNVEQ